MIGDRSSKRPLFVSKKLTLQQIRRDGAAINGNKRPILTLRAVMYCLSNQLFAATAFTSNENTDVCRRN